MSEQPTPDNPTADNDAIRASDSERAATVERLKAAHDEGRLTLDEFTERIAKVREAQTRAALQALIADLPAASARASGDQAGTHVSGRLPADVRVLPIGGWKQRGRFRLDRDITIYAILGGIDLDLRNAEFAADEITIASHSLLGGAEVKLPPNVRVEVSGISLLGGREIKVEQPTDPNAPLLRLRIYRLIGGVEVEND